MVIQMNLSKSQQQLFWSKWSAATKAQGWRAKDSASAMNSAEIEQQRHLLLERAGFSSLRDVDPLKGFDRVLAELALLINPSDLSAQVRLQNQPAIRQAYTIDQLKTKIAQVSPGNNYLRVVMLDKFNTTNWDQLTLEQFIQLYATLRNRKKSAQRRSADLQSAVSQTCSLPGTPTDQGNQPF